MENQKPINVPLSAMKDCRCGRCGSLLFRQVFFIREIPALLSPSARSERVTIPAFQCTRCNSLFEFDIKPVQKRVGFLAKALNWYERLISDLKHKIDLQWHHAH